MLIIFSEKSKGHLAITRRLKDTRRGSNKASSLVLLVKEAKSHPYDRSRNFFKFYYY